MPNIAAGTGAGNAVLLQSANSVNGNVSSASKAFNFNNTAGDLLVVVAAWGDNAGGGPTLNSISDSQGNLYATAVGPIIDDPVSANHSKVELFYAANVKGGANTVTVTLSTTPGVYLDFYMHEYSGIMASSPLDQVSTATGTGVSVNTGTATTTQSNELLFAFGLAPSISSAGNGFTLRQVADGNATADQNVNSVGAYTATFTSTTGMGWTACDL